MIGSIWREKFEEMVVENAELQVKLSVLEKQMSCSLGRVQHSVTKLSTELTRLKCCIDDSDSSLSHSIQSDLTSDNSSSMDMIS